jgi:hypothetical protein
MTSIVSSKDQVCTECQTAYVATHYSRAGIDTDASTGLCYVCQRKKYYRPVRVKCRICGKEFSTEALMTMDVRITRDTCPECTKQEIQNREALRLSQIAKQRLLWRKGSGIPFNQMGKGFEDFDKTVKGNIAKVFCICKCYARYYPVEYKKYLKAGNKAYPSLVLFSTLDMVGVGKTHLACSILHEILNRWKGEGMEEDEGGLGLICKRSNPVQIISEPDLYRMITVTYSYTPEEKRVLDCESDIINRLVSRDLLVIDDIGKEPRKDMDFVQRTLFGIIDGRYKNSKPIIITTNKAPNELKDYLGEASYDRLNGMIGGVLHKCNGESFRKKEMGG